MKSYVNPDSDDIDGDGDFGDDDDATAVIEYTLDPGYDGGKYAGTRDPDWPLGDIYNSIPVVVAQPKLHISYRDGYADFRITEPQASRDTMIYIGANDGMLHAINDSNGQERWAWIPNCILGTLHGFADGHKFTVDLSPRAADVDLSVGCTGGTNGNGWKTMVVAGLRRGGNKYLALDVTDPDNPAFMWEKSDDNGDDNMGRTWSLPEYGRININGVHTSVIFVGGGYSSNTNRGNRAYILDAGTGSVLKEFEVGTSSNNVPSQILCKPYLLNDQGVPMDYITREALDLNMKGLIEVGYFGDTAGTMWKLSGLNADSGWNPVIEELFVPPVSGERMPIFHRPVLSDVYENCYKRFVLFGTGDESEPEGNFQNYFYEVEDRALTEEEEGLPTADRLAARMIWRYDFDFAEQMLSDPTVHRGVVYFTTYQPEGGCNMGYSFLYGLTTSMCGSEGIEGGGEAGIEFGLDGPLPYPVDKIDLDKGIASTPVIAPPALYIQLPTGAVDGDGGLEPPKTFQVPTAGGELLYWREVD